MKAFRQKIAFAILATICILLQSCSKDDESSVKEYDGTLYGEWIGTSGYYYRDYIYFGASGDGTKGSWDVDLDWAEDEEDFKWYTKDDKTLYIDGRAYKYWCDGSELEIHWNNKTVRYLAR